MRGFLIRWLGSAVILMVVAEAIGAGAGPDPFEVSSPTAALFAVAVVALVNVVLQPIASVIKTMGCVLNLATLGLFGLVVSFVFYALAFYLVGDFTRAVPGFEVTGFGAAANGAIWMAVGNALLNALVSRDEEKRERERERR